MDASTIQFGRCRIHLPSRTLIRDGDPVELQPKVFDLLVYLIAHRDRVASQSELLDALWPGIAVTPSALSRAVHKARRALGDDGDEQRLIVTVHGRGFRFVGRVDEVEETSSTTSPQEARGARVPDPGAGIRRAIGVGATLLCGTALAWWILASGDIAAKPEEGVAVLPFVDMSPRGDQQYLADGITQELIHALAQVPGLRVLSRRSALAFRDLPVGPRAIGDELGVETLVEGSVRQDGERLRITAELVEAQDGRQLWSRAYDRHLDDVFSIQREIASEVTAVLAPGIAQESPMPALRSAPRSFRAYELALRGSFFHAQLTEEGLRRAADYYGQALSIDSDYALAHAWLADCHHALIMAGAESREEGLPLARAAVERALAIDEGLADAHLAAGRLRMLERDWGAAEAHFLRALELDPGNAESPFAYGYFLMNLGDVSGATRQMQRALELDPLSPETHRMLAALALYEEDYARGISRLQAAIELAPDQPGGKASLWIAYAEAGDEEAAIEALVQGVTADERVRLERAHRQGGFREALRAWLTGRIEESGARCSDFPRATASLWAYLGDADRAFECLEMADREGLTDSLKSDFLLRPYRDDPRFSSLLRRSGLDPDGPFPLGGHGSS